MDASEGRPLQLVRVAHDTLFTNAAANPIRGPRPLNHDVGVGWMKQKQKETAKEKKKTQPKKKKKKKVPQENKRTGSRYKRYECREGTNLSRVFHVVACDYYQEAEQMYLSFLMMLQPRMANEIDGTPSPFLRISVA